MAYCGFEGGVDAIFSDVSERKAGGERPNAEGENPFGRERCVLSAEPLGLPDPDAKSVPDIGKIDGRVGEG